MQQALINSGLVVVVVAGQCSGVSLSEEMHQQLSMYHLISINLTLLPLVIIIPPPLLDEITGSSRRNDSRMMMIDYSRSRRC